MWSLIPIWILKIGDFQLSQKSDILFIAKKIHLIFNLGSARKKLGFREHIGR